MKNYYITESGDKVEIIDMEYIDISNERITEVFITDISNCKYLYLYNNKLKSVELNLPKCEVLNLSYNNLESVDLNLPKCETLFLHYNNLKSVDLNLQVCDTFCLDHNNLESIDLNLPLCNVLLLHHNNIKSFEISIDLPMCHTLYSGSDKIVQSNGDTIMGFDGIPIIVDSEKKLGEFTIYSGRFNRTNKEVIVASRGEYCAHGDTIKKAIEDCNFKFLQATIDVGPYFAECKEKGVMSVSDYRLLTGACESGCKHFLESKGIISIEMKFDDAMKLLEENEPYGWGKIKELI